MRSGLWILLLVILAGIVVGTLLKGRLNQAEEADDIAVLRNISVEEDPEARIEQLRQFLVDYPETEYESDAYYMIAGTMLNDQGDTSGMIAFAEETIETADDPETRAAMYYRLYRATDETRPDDAYLYALRLRDSGIEVAWVYNYIAYDYAERDERLGLAATLADRAVDFAGSAEDSSSYLDTRGWVYFKAGDYERALGDLEEAVRVSPEPSAEILGHLAEAQLKMGRNDEAFDTFREVLVMGEYAGARENIAALMDRRGYTRQQRETFEKDLWTERMDRAAIVEPFTLKKLDGADFEYRPEASTLSIINFFSPT